MQQSQISVLPLNYYFGGKTRKLYLRETAEIKYGEDPLERAEYQSRLLSNYQM